MQEVTSGVKDKRNTWSSAGNKENIIKPGTWKKEISKIISYIFQMTVNSLLHIFKTNLEHKKKKTNQSSSYKLSFKDISAMAREFV